MKLLKVKYKRVKKTSKFGVYSYPETKYIVELSAQEYCDLKDTITVNKKDASTILKIMDNPPEPTDELINLMKGK